MKDKIVIVGHGLAGSVLAHTFLRKGIRVMVLDAKMAHSASRVSVGLINPFIGPKFNIPDDFSLCMNQNFEFFNNIEKNCGEEYLHPIELHRVFQNSQQQEKWKLLSQTYRGRQLSSQDCQNLGFDAPLGAGITKAWKLKVKKFLSFSENHLASISSFREEVFKPSKWKNETIIFCDGYRSIQHEWFSQLPFNPAQGDVLKIESRLRLTLSNGSWHLPCEAEHTARIGSNWKHQDIESGPTEEAKREIRKKISYLPNSESSKVLEHSSGVRSGTIDRQPMIGRHPHKENYYLFNGFGSRGCTTIAKNAQDIAGFLLNGRLLPSQVDLTRFLK